MPPGRPKKYLTPEAKRAAVRASQIKWRKSHENEAKRRDRERKSEERARQKALRAQVADQIVDQGVENALGSQTSKDMPWEHPPRVGHFPESHTGREYVVPPRTDHPAVAMRAPPQIDPQLDVQSYTNVCKRAITASDLEEWCGHVRDSILDDREWGEQRHQNVLRAASKGELEKHLNELDAAVEDAEEKGSCARDMMRARFRDCDPKRAERVHRMQLAVERTTIILLEEHLLLRSGYEKYLESYKRHSLGWQTRIL